MRTRSQRRGVRVAVAKSKPRRKIRKEPKKLSASLSRLEKRKRTLIDLVQLVTLGLDQILPAKSRKTYERIWTQHDSFIASLSDSDRALPLSDQLLGYFVHQSKRYSPSTLWTQQSAIKKKYELRGQDLAVFGKATSFLKALNKNYKPKKAAVFTLPQLQQFLLSVPAAEADVVLAISLLLHGGMRRAELVALTWDDVLLCKSQLVVNIKKSKTDAAGQGFTFVVSAHPDQRLCGVEAYKRYSQSVLSSIGDLQGRIFHQFHFGRYTHQLVGQHYAARLAKRCARFLGLEEALYTAHSWRRTAATVLADAGAQSSYLTLLHHPSPLCSPPLLPPECVQFRIPPTHPSSDHLANKIRFYSSPARESTLAHPKHKQNHNTHPHTHSFLALHPSFGLTTGVSLTNLKQFGRWQSSSVAEGYVAESVAAKQELSRTLLSQGQPAEMRLEAGPIAEEDDLDDALASLEVGVDLADSVVMALPSTQVILPQSEGVESTMAEEEGPTDQELLEVLALLKEDYEQSLSLTEAAEAKDELEIGSVASLASESPAVILRLENAAMAMAA